MMKSLKHILFLIVLSPLLFAGCNDLFDEGDVEQAYEGPDVVGFFPQQSSVDEGSSTTIEVQLISSEGLAASDIAVNVSVDEGESTATSDHYSLGSTSVTIPSGSATADLTVNFPADSGLDGGDEVMLIITISGGDVSAAENLKSTTIFIQGVDD